MQNSQALLITSTQHTRDNVGLANTAELLQARKIFFPSLFRNYAFVHKLKLVRTQAEGQND